MARGSQGKKSVPSAKAKKGTLKLLPCPHCGRKPIQALDIFDKHFTVCCNPRCREIPSTPGEDTQEGSTKAWNRMVLQAIRTDW
jgi:hypothetical protein